MVVGWLVLAWATAGAAGGDVVLDWQAPAGCPQAAEVRARVRAAWTDREAVAVAASGRVAQQDDPAAPWRVELRVGDAAGERVLVGRSCDALTDAAVLVLVVAATSQHEAAIVPTPPPEPPPPEPTPAAPAIAPAAIAPVVAPPRPAAPPRRRAVHGELALMGGFDAVAMPGLGGTIGASIGLRVRWLGVHAFALHGIRRRVTDRGVAARHQLIAGGLAGCGLGTLGSFELGACAKVELGALFSAGIEGDELRGHTALWAAASLGPLARWRFARRWALSLGIDGVVPLVPWSFAIGQADVGRTGSLGVRVLAGIGVRLG